MLKFNLLHTFPAFTIKNYRTFFLSQWVALMGLWMQLTAQQWLVYEITDSPLLLGVLSTMQYMPSLLFTLWTGFWIDRQEKYFVGNTAYVYAPGFSFRAHPVERSY